MNTSPATLLQKRAVNRTLTLFFIMAAAIFAIVAMVQITLAACDLAGQITWHPGSYTAGKPSYNNPVSQTIPLTATNGTSVTTFSLTIGGATSSPGDVVVDFGVVNERQGNILDDIFLMRRDGISTSSTTSLTFGFDMRIDDVAFTIMDIDICRVRTATQTSDSCYRDKVTVIGFDGNTEVKPLITATNPAAVTVVENVATANTTFGNANTFQDFGNVRVKFQAPVDRYVIFYGNTPDSIATQQHIAMTSVSYGCPSSPTAVTLSNLGINNTANWPVSYLFWALSLLSLTGAVLLKRQRPTAVTKRSH